MYHMLWMLSVCCVALALPGHAGAQERRDVTVHAVAGAAAPTAAEVCRLDVDPEIAANPEYLWRFQAYRQLDCVIGILDKALKASKTGQTVTLSREDAERVRHLAIWAKDAAARIGR